MVRTLSIDPLARTSEYRSLPPKHQLWLATYCQTLIDLGVPDVEFATRSVFDAHGQSVRTFGYEILAREDVRAALRVFLKLGETKRAPFLVDLRLEVDRLLALYARIATSSKRKRG